MGALKGSQVSRCTGESVDPNIRAPGRQLVEAVGVAEQSLAEPDARHVGVGAIAIAAGDELLNSHAL